jgi:hypothetical protein
MSGYQGPTQGPPDPAPQNQGQGIPQNYPTQQYQVPGYADQGGNQGQQGYQAQDQGYQAQQGGYQAQQGGYQAQQGYQPQGYQDQGYQQGYPGQGYQNPTAQFAPPRQRRRGRRALITIVVILVVLVAGDFAAKAVAESVFASKLAQQAHLSNKPSVDIEGFPFLTQIATRNIHEVKITDSNLREGPLTVSSVDIVASGIHLNSYAFNSGTVNTVQGTIVIGFGSLDNVLNKEVPGLGSALGSGGLHVHQSGPNEITASLNLLVTSASATWRIVKVSGTQVDLTLVRSSGLGSLLGNMQTVPLHLPKLPLKVTIDNISVTPNGIVATVTGTGLKFSQ